MRVLARFGAAHRLGTFHYLRKELSRSVCEHAGFPRRYIHIDGRNRLSTFWAPSGGITPKKGDEDDPHSLLVRAGYLKQVNAGIFHLLPLGLRVQEKIESLIHKHMKSIGAARVSLSSITSEELWAKSGRLEAFNSELFRLKDGRDAGLMLSPTHEEEITSLIASNLISYKSLPLRLYQISRKYRNERRPRQGLLRAREFLMKDLYTFDVSGKAALETYQQVRNAYEAFFTELKIPFITAEATSGDMGGSLSHEYHLASNNGEDVVCKCSNCGYAANEEIAEKRKQDYQAPEKISAADFAVWSGISHDRRTLVNAYYPRYSSSESRSADESQNEVSVSAVKNFIPELDPSVNAPLSVWKDLWHNQQTSNDSSVEQHDLCVVNLIDNRLPRGFSDQVRGSSKDDLTPERLRPYLKPPTRITTRDVTTNPWEDFDLTRIKAGDPCPRCDSKSLQMIPAIEVGHTFHLETRYTIPFGAHVEVPGFFLTEERQEGSMLDKASMISPIQMGCHGIGVSRLIGAVAAVLSDDRGLNWPRVVAPFEVVVVVKGVTDEDAKAAYDSIVKEVNGVDVVLDDRHQGLPWKLADADLVGYPVIVILGNVWKRHRKCEVQCRRLGNLRERVTLKELPRFVKNLLDQL